MRVGLNRTRIGAAEGGAAGGRVPAGAGGPGERLRPPFAMTRYLEAELDLTGEQRERIQAIVRRRRERSGEIMRDLRARLRAQVDSTVAAIDEILTPEQRERFRALRVRLRERGGPGPGVPPRSRGPGLRGGR